MTGSLRRNLIFAAFLLVGSLTWAFPEPTSSNKEDISLRQITAGAAVGSFSGLGTGHLIQHRYASDGAWKYTATQLAGITMAGFGYENGWTGPLGAITFTASRIWEIIDLWRYRQKTSFLSEPTTSIDPTGLFILPTKQGPQLSCHWSF